MDIDDVSKALEHCVKLGAEYADARLEIVKGTSISARMGSIEAATSSSTLGVGIRVLVNGSWGFSSADNPSGEDLLKAAETAVKLAKAAAPARSRRVVLAEAGACRAYVTPHIKTSPLNVSLEDKVRLVLEAEKAASGHSQRIRDDRINYTDSVFEKVFLSSEGAEIRIRGVRTYLAVYTAAAEAGVISPSFEAIGGVKGYEVFEETDPVDLAVKTAERAVNLLKASMPKGGLATVVLDNKLLALIVHEAFGHAAEADLVLTGDMLTGKIGEQVASHLVTIVDSPVPENANGWTPYDDEGVKARPVRIVEEGILKGFMHTRETAALLDTEPTGNARAQSYAYPPLVRMRNTYMEPRDWRPEEIIEETRDGYYLKGALGGQADTNGVFMFSVQEAWRIENGELKEPYRGVTVSGDALSVLKSVDAVGNDLMIGFPGTCGKMQSVPVDGGGPHIRCRIMIGGGR